MSSGELRNKVQIESLTHSGSSNNGDFASEQTWGVVDEVWASITKSKGDEDSDARDNTTQKAIIKIRYRSDINERMRITHNGEIFDIESIQDRNSRRQYLWLHTFMSLGAPATVAYDYGEWQQVSW